MLLRISDIGALEIGTDTLVGVSRVYHHYVRVLFQQLANDTVHMERLAASAWPDTEEIGVVRELYGSFLSRDVYGHRQSLPVGIIGGQRGVLRMLQVLLVKEAQGGIAQRQEQIVVRIERVGTTWETGHIKLKLVIGRP